MRIFTHIIKVLPLLLVSIVLPLSATAKLPYAHIKPYKARIDRSDAGYKRLFHDKQDIQLPVAVKLGISPLKDDKAVKRAAKRGQIKRVESSKYFQVTANYPYLTPKAHTMLTRIAQRYQAKAGKKKKLRITSCLRTKAQVEQLMKSNINATRNSCHLYGRTFDISYARMSAADKEALARTLKELQDAGYIYVTYETKQPCFHITVRRL